MSTPAAERITWANAGELYEGLEWEARRRGVQRKLNADLHQGGCCIYGVLRKRAIEGEISITVPQLAADTGQGEATVRRHLRMLERAGFIRTAERTTGTGKTLCLAVELVPVSEVTALRRTRGCSSAG